MHGPVPAPCRRPDPELETSLETVPLTEAQLKVRSQCLGIQRKHGNRAAPIAGGPRNKRVRCQAALVPPAGHATAPCTCVIKRGHPAAQRRSAALLWDAEMGAW